MNKIWRYIPAGLGHWLVPMTLPLVSTRESDFLWKSFWWKGLYFRNRIGIAGGVDKNAKNLLDWQRLGAGFLEVGTITPRAQKANRGTILMRDWDQQLLWNKMGFPNEGADDVFFNILKDREEIKVPIFVNLGKNRDTKNTDASKDYVYVAERFLAVTDAFVINVSSPNTQDLRQLQASLELEKIITQVLKVIGSRPILVKLSPDMEATSFAESIKTSLNCGANGFILTNTTLQRPANSRFPKEGGVSGNFLKNLSRHVLKTTIELLGDQRKDKLLVSVGGVTSVDEVAERLTLGADLVQTYSGLVFNGPKFFANVSDHFSKASVQT